MGSRLPRVRSPPPRSPDKGPRCDGWGTTTTFRVVPSRWMGPSLVHPSPFYTSHLPSPETRSFRNLWGHPVEPEGGSPRYTRHGPRVGFHHRCGWSWRRPVRPSADSSWSQDPHPLKDVQYPPETPLGSSPRGVVFGTPQVHRGSCVEIFSCPTGVQRISLRFLKILVFVPLATHRSEVSAPTHLGASDSGVPGPLGYLCAWHLPPSTSLSGVRIPVDRKLVPRLW